MTDAEKLELLDRFEDVAWESLGRLNPTSVIEVYDLRNIDRCQRIRASLERQKPAKKTVSSGIYQRPSAGDEGF